CTQVQDEPGSISVTFQTSFAMPGCLIANRLPTARAGPSSPTREVTEAVQSGQCSTSLKTSHTSCGGASISTLSSLNMYQMVHRVFRFAYALTRRGRWPYRQSPLRGECVILEYRRECGGGMGSVGDTANTSSCVAPPCRTPGVVSEV